MQEVTVYEPIWVPEPDKKTPPKRAGRGGSSGPGGPDYDDLIREIELRDRINDQLRSLMFDNRRWDNPFDLEALVHLPDNLEPDFRDDLFADPDKIVGEERDGRDQAQGDGWQAFLQNLTEALESLDLEPRDWAHSLCDM